MPFSPSPKMLRLAAALWTLLIFVALSIPNPEDYASGPSLSDKAAHVLLFATFGALWMHALRSRTSLTRSAGHVLFWGTIYGMLLEAYQGLLPALGRSAELLDALANMLGLIAAVAVYVIWTRAGRR